MTQIALMNKDRKIGKSFPLGATVCPDGVNFSVFAKGGEAVQLLLFDHVDDAQPSQTIRLDPISNRSRHYWHVFVPGIEVGQIYGLPSREGRPGARTAIRSAKGVARPVRPCNCAPCELQPGGCDKARR